MSKEIYIYQTKSTKETDRYEKRPRKNVSAACRYFIRGNGVVYTSKETYVCEKRPAKETYKKDVSAACCHFIRGNCVVYTSKETCKRDL